MVRALLARLLGVPTRAEVDAAIYIATYNLEYRMATSNAAEFARLDAAIRRVADGYAALRTERDAYRDKLTEADADKAAAVQSALDADEQHDGAAIDGAASQLDALLREPTTPPADEPAPPVTDDQPPVDEPAPTPGDTTDPSDPAEVDPAIEPGNASGGDDTTVVDNGDGEQPTS